MSSPISKVVRVIIKQTATTPTKKGFGKPLLLAYHTLNTDKIREYSDLTGLADDGFGTSSPAYLMAQAAFSQKPRPKTLKIGRLTTAVADTRQLTVTSSTAGDVITVTITDAAGVAHVITRTVPALSSLAAEATAVAALIAAIAGVASATAVGAVITVTIAAAGAKWYYGSLAHLTILDTTPDASVDNDLTAIEKVDSDFYGIACQYGSKANADKIAAWVETREYIQSARTADDVELTGNNIGSNWKGLSYQNSFLLFSRDEIHFPDAAWLGCQLPKNPGSSNYAYKTLIGVLSDALSTDETAHLESNNVNYYETIAGIAHTKYGITPSGLFIDEVVGLHALSADMRERVFGLLVSNEKLPYTDLGISMAASEMRASLKKFVRQNFLDGGNGKDVDPPTVTQPAVSDIDPADRKNRLLPDMKFSARKSGAVNKLDIQGVLTI